MRTPAIGRFARLGLLAALVAALCAAIPAVVSAAKSSPEATTSKAKSAHGVRPTSPKNGAIVPKNTFPTFKARVRGKGVVYFIVCKSKKRNADGKLCDRNTEGLADISRGAKGKKVGSSRVRFFKPEKYTFPSYYLQVPGTYYWQAYRIECIRTNRRGSRYLDCAQESPTQKFTVK